MTSISTLGQSLDQMERMKRMQLQLATLQNQLVTGKKTYDKREDLRKKTALREVDRALKTRR